MNERIEQFKKRIETIFNLGAVELKTDTKKIVVNGDKFTVQKNIYGDDKATDSEMNAKVNSLYDLADILSTSKYIGKEIEGSFKDSNIKPKNKAHQGVKYWYKFGNTIYFDDVLYDVTFSIRDKGKEQYQYLIDFKEKNKDGSNQTYGQTDLRRAIDEPSSDNRVPQKNSVVKNNIRQSGENDTSFDKPMSVSRKVRAEDAIAKYKESGDDFLCKK